MTIPHTARIGLLVLVTTAFYGYVGQIGAAEGSAAAAGDRHPRPT